MKPRTLTLFSTSACHLCELAEAILSDLARSGVRFELNKVDIVDDDALMERYGVRIPVVRRENTGAELGWPFTADDLRGFLAD